MTKAKSKMTEIEVKGMSEEMLVLDGVKKKVTYDLGKRCKNCDARVSDKPSNKLFCDRGCRDDYFNAQKKAQKQELEQLKLKTDIQAQENKLREIIHQSDDVKKLKADMQLHLKGLDVSAEGIKVDVNYLNQINFDINLYDKLIESKKHPGKYIAEYGDFGFFWINTYDIMIINKQNYLLWEL